MRILPSLLSVSLVFAYPVWALEPINIGICVPLSGRLAERGHPMLLGIKIAHQMRPQVLGRPVALKVANSHSEPANTAVAFFSLIERQHVAAILSGLTCDNIATGSSHAEKRGIPIVASFAASAGVRMGNTCVYRLGCADTDQSCLAAKIARSCVKAGTAGLVCDISHESSIRMAACFKKEFLRRGGRVSVETRIKAGDRDFTAQINRIKSARPDAIYAPISCTECALFARQARLMGVQAPMLAGQQVHAPELIALGGKSVENLLFTSHVSGCSSLTEWGKRFAAACQFHTGEAPLPDQVMAAEAYVVLLDAIERAGDARPTKIREALASTQACQGTAATIGRVAGASSSRAVFVSQVKNGQFVPYRQEVRPMP